MRPSRRKLIWFIPAAIAAGIAAAILIKRPAVTLSVISVQRASGSPTARCEIRNHGEKPIEFTIHSLGQTPFYHRLERSGVSWRRVLWDMECGIDAETRVLAPGQTFPFIASIIDASQPIRLAVSYQLDGADFTACSETIHPGRRQSSLSKLRRACPLTPAPQFTPGVPTPLGSLSCPALRIPHFPLLTSPAWQS
jgi:hypothetical protein